MFFSRLTGHIKLHLLLQFLGAQVVFWMVYGLMVWTNFRDDLEFPLYLNAGLILVIAFTLELVTRTREAGQLAGMSRERLWSLTQRQILFALTSIFGSMVMTKDDSLSRIFLATYFIVFSLWIAWTNHYGNRLVHRLLYRSKAKGQTSTVLLGSESTISSYCEKIAERDLPGMNLLGYVSSDQQTPVPLSAGGAVAIDYLGPFSDLEQICQSTKARLLLILGLREHEDLVDAVSNLCASQGMRSIWMDDLAQRYGHRFTLRQERGMMMMAPVTEPLESPINRIAKRAFDLSVSAFLLATIFPISVLFVKLIHLRYSRGSLFYRQERSGRHGERFEIYKFRSMHANDTPAKQVVGDDPRVFRGGNFIRRFSIDELPQLLNVFLGQMSLVGPRPHFVEHDEQFAEVIREYPVRYFTKPGITGLAQVRGCRGETGTVRKLRNRVRYDLFYVQHWSPILDVQILAETLAELVFPANSAR